jgi:cell division control protein 6
LRDRAYATTGEVEKSYGVVCEEYEEKQYGHTQLWDNIKELNILGLIGAKKSGKGFAGKTTLISIPDIPTNVLEEKIIELIKK